MRTREETQINVAEWRAANPEKEAAIQARRRANYQGTQREKRLLRYQARAEVEVAYRAAYYQANADKMRAAAREWSRANPELRRAKGAARRAREAGAEGSHTVAEWLQVCRYYGDRCAYCDRSVPLERDHVTPLSLGGSDYIANIVPACRPCNASKRDKPLSTWAPTATAVGAPVPA